MKNSTINRFWILTNKKVRTKAEDDYMNALGKMMIKNIKRNLTKQ